MDLVLSKVGPVDCLQAYWEDAVPHLQLVCWVRSLGLVGKAAYGAYRETGGPPEITDVAHIASAVATHLNYVGCQAELLLNDEYVEQHDFARTQVTGATQSLPGLRNLEQWIREFRVGVAPSIEDAQ